MKHHILHNIVLLGMHHNLQQKRWLVQFQGLDLHNKYLVHKGMGKQYQLDNSDRLDTLHRRYYQLVL